MSAWTPFSVAASYSSYLIARELQGTTMVSSRRPFAGSGKSGTTLPHPPPSLCSSPKLSLQQWPMLEKEKIGTIARRCTLL